MIQVEITKKLRKSIQQRTKKKYYYYFVENYLFNCINKDHHWNQGIIKLTNESRDTSIAFFVGYALINIESSKFTC